jgi:hypothetical protein
MVAGVASADGWFGASLAEVASTASLVVHVGSSHFQEAPMLACRYFNPAAQHVFLDTCPTQLLSELQSAEGVTELQWSKEQWLDGLSRTLLMVRDDSAALSRAADPIDADASILAELLLNNTYSVWLWSEDELSDELDRLIAERIMELSRQISRTSRCSVLSLAMDPGRVTAKDCILWLTNHTPPVRIGDHGWMKDRLLIRSLQEWRASFDWILCVRNLPSDRPLPEVEFDLVLDAHCNRASTTPSTQTNRVSTQAVGVDSHGQLMRGDHGLAAYVPAVQSDVEPRHPHVVDLLNDWSLRAASLRYAAEREVRS